MENENNVIRVYAAAEEYAQFALRVAQYTGGVLIGAAPPEEGGPPALRCGGDGVSLVCGAQEIRGDFARLAKRARKSNLREELIVRACKLKDVPRPKVIDATAGLGEDSFLLAAAGCEVTLFERDAVIAALLEDALRRAYEDEGLALVCARMRFEKGDSIAAMKDLTDPPDIIFLDPMFPKREKSALVKKKLQLLKQLEPPCADEEALFCAAAAAKARRIVVKRPPKGPFLAGRKPDYSLTGKAVRFDCYSPSSSS